MRRLQTDDGGREPFQGGLEFLRILIRAGGLMGRGMGKGGDAPCALLIGLRERFDLGLEIGEQVQQIGSALRRKATGIFELRLNLLNLFLNHVRREWPKAWME